MSYRVAFLYPDGSLGSHRIGLNLSRDEAVLVARRENQKITVEIKGAYVVIDADTEEVDL